jgi:periplasmic protein TonB
MLTMKKMAAAMIAGGFLTAAFAGTAMAAPVPVKREAPEYPKGAEKRGIEGYVQLKFNVDADGNVVSPQVVEGSPPGVFDAAAIEALTKWKYEKGAAASDMQVKLSFKLQ